MKKIMMTLNFLLAASMLFAVDYIDVVEKKDGSIFKGIVIENKINDFIKIELDGGSIFKIPYSEIEIMKKEKSKNNSSDSIIINNSNNNVNSNENANSNMITGYDHFELISMLQDIPLPKLKKVKVDSVLMRNTEFGTRANVYSTLEEESVVGYTILNILIPGVGSIAQGDKGHGWFSLIASTLCTIIGYSLLYDYSMSTVDTYDYYSGSYESSTPDENALLLGTALLVASSGINISSWFAPSSYKKQYNKQLKITLMY